MAAFWQWWTDQGRAAAERSIDGTDPARFTTAMAAQVQQLGELGWELAPGETSEHVLVITAEGDPALRATARRLILAAPAADEQWAFLDTRPPMKDPETAVLDAAGKPGIDLGRVSVAARMVDGRLDVQVHHPVFAELPAEARTQVTFLALDAALGEVDTELWLGEVVPVEFPPLDGFGLRALRSAVHDLKEQRLDADGRPRWLMLRGETPEGPLLAMAQSPLHPLTAPHLDTYVSLSLPYAHRTADGLPDGPSLESLRGFEDHLEGALGLRGRVVAHLSHAGVRTLHLYVDSTADLLPTLKTAAKAWDEGKASVHDMHDPGWAAVSHLQG